MKNLFFLLFLITSTFTFAQNVDLSSVDEFFKITDKLKNEEEISDNDWNNFEKSKAYAIFTNKYVIDIAKSSIQNVFGSYNINTDNSNNLLKTLVLANYEEINYNYSSLKTFRDNYDFESLIYNAKSRLQSFLMCELDSSVEWKPVYFLFLNKDGQDRDSAIVIDLNQIYKMTEQQRIDFIAHEFFHVYRSHFENHDFNYANDIYFALDMIANEGIADQIDKYNMDYEQYYSTVIGSQELKDEFINLYENAEKDIEYLQDIIVQYSKNQIDKETCIDKLLEIYKYNGHALGFYMSNQIIMAGLKDEMIKEFHNPYEFFRLYSLTLPKDEKASLNDDFLLFLKAETEQYY